MSSTFGPAEAQAYMHKLLTVMHQQGGSDLFISADFPPSRTFHRSIQRG